MSARPRRRPYWTVVAFAAVMLAPAPISTVALIGIAATAAALGVARVIAARRARAEAEAGGATLLGRDGAGKPVALTDDQLSSHALILGASGAGKSTTLLRILTDHVSRGSPVVAIDMKGSPAFARQLADAAAAAGRPFRLWTPDGPGHWNPLQHGNATELKDKLIATERFTEPHYQRAAERYVQRTLQVLEKVHPDRPPTLADVVEAMDPRRLPAMLRALPRQLAEQVQDYVSSLTPDQRSAVAGLRTRLAILTESHTGPYLGPPLGGGGEPSLGGPPGGPGERWLGPAPSGPGERSLGPPPSGPGTSAAVDVRAALSGRDVVLFSLNSSTYGRLAAQLGTLAIQDLVAAAGSRLAEPDRPQAIVGIDEFSGLGADHVVSLLARCRESGIGVLLATQELADLERAARGLRDQVVGVTAVKIAHRQEVPASARAIAEMTGTEKVWEETRQIGGGLFGHDTGRGTRRQVEQFVVDPSSIARLGRGQAVVITKLPSARTRTVQVTPPAAAPSRPPDRGPRRSSAPAQPPERHGPELG